MQYILGHLKLKRLNSEGRTNSCPFRLFSDCQESNADGQVPCSLEHNVPIVFSLLESALERKERILFFFIGLLLALWDTE